MPTNKILIGNVKGPKGDQGVEGPQGPQGVQGADGKDGAGVPDGGSEGQVLAKSGNDNQQTKWIDIYDKAQMDAKIQTINDSINALKSVKEVTLGTSWSGGSQTVSVEGITTNDSPILDVKLDGVEDIAIAQEEWAKIAYALTSEGSIVFYLNDSSNPTTAEIVIKVKGV